MTDNTTDGITENSDTVTYGPRVDGDPHKTVMGVRHVIVDGRWMQPEPLLWLWLTELPLSPRTLVGHYVSLPHTDHPLAA